jgi:hypothetical protein
MGLAVICSMAKRLFVQRPPPATQEISAGIRPGPPVQDAVLTVDVRQQVREVLSERDHRRAGLGKPGIPAAL